MKICECGHGYNSHDISAGTCSDTIDLPEWNAMGLPCFCDEFSYGYEEKQPEMSYCNECGKYPADLPSKRCQGCDTYMEHLYL